ncbi:putative N-alkane-inducible cytochrome P450 [Aspergillus heterothallicus]
MWLGCCLVLPVAGLYIIRFIYTFVRVRRLFSRLKEQEMPMIKWNPIIGNLASIAGVMKTAPKDATAGMTFAQLAFDSGFDNCFYLDTWPFGPPMLAVTSPDLAIQTCQSHNLRKPDSLIPHIRPMAGGPSIFDTNGAEAKRGREIFHYGFSMRSVFGYMPYLLQEVEVYVDVLRDLAKTGETFSLDTITCRYVMDIIGNVTMQRRYHPIASSMRDTIDLQCQVEAGLQLSRMNPFRVFRQWQNSRTLNHHIGLELEKRYQEWKEQEQTSTTSSAPKTLMDIAIAEHMKSRPIAAGANLDPEFKAWATSQIRLFLFVGHDSTAVTIMYAYYLLSKHPEVLAKLRAEHDELLGTNLAKTAPLLLAHPELINKLSYTLAVTKEVLRLYPPANALREGSPNVTLCNTKTGISYPTDGFAIWVLHHAVHRNPAHWVDPHAFIPDRWLVEPGHPLYPPTGGWRPFEHGARDCIGQALALLDIRTTLVMTVREFDFRDQYVEWDRENPGHGVNSMFGDRAYMIQAGSGRPAQGMPCKVFLTSRSSCI